MFTAPALPRLQPAPDAIDRVVRFLDALPETLPSIWLGPRIEPHIPLERLLGFDCGDASAWLRLRDGHKRAFETLDRALAQAVADSPVRYVSLQTLIDFRIGEDVMDCDAVYWADGDHWSAAGQLRFGQRLVDGL
jgi:hypothetical protein